MTDYIKQVAITGDISKIGDNDELIRAWCSETAKEIWEQKPEFAIIHLQGLNNSQDPDYVARVIYGGIMDVPEIFKLFSSSRAFFDTRVTGLGSLYLFSTPDAVQYFDRFSNSGYHNVDRHQNCIGSTECDGFIQNTFNQKYSFTRDFYRDDGSRDVSQQRCGFLLARFRIHSKEMTFVNLNLHSVPFEDVNEIATQPEVTQAAKTRQQQIDILLQELEIEGLHNDAILVAGAFNAQLHETQLLDYLAKTQMVSKVAKKDDEGNVEAIEHFDRHGRNITTVERSRFDLHSIHDWFFRLGRGQMVKRREPGSHSPFIKYIWRNHHSDIKYDPYNGEMAKVTFKGTLLEESVFFQPSRHYETNVDDKEVFMRTLCPAWADRILYNEKMSDLFRHDSFCASGLYYGLVAEEKFVGQFKPVALHATICIK